MSQLVFHDPRGWQNVHQEAYVAYNKNNIDEKIDDLIHLTVYIKLVNGNNYKIIFIDRKAEYPTIQEYIFYKPFDGDYNLTNHSEYTGSDNFIGRKDEQFTLIENKLYHFMKKRYNT